MKKTTIVLCTLFLSTVAYSQRPTDPKYLIPEKAPLLDYVSVSDSLPLPPGTMIGPPAANAFDSKNHMFVLNRGPQALAEFDADGKFIRFFGDGLLKRAHGLVIDKADNIWVTDVEANIVMKLSPHGKILMTLGTKGEKGDWNEAIGFHFFDGSAIVISCERLADCCGGNNPRTRVGLCEVPNVCGPGPDAGGLDRHKMCDGSPATPA